MRSNPILTTTPQIVHARDALQKSVVNALTAQQEAAANNTATMVPPRKLVALAAKTAALLENAASNSLLT